MSTTRLALEQLLSQAIGDDLEFTVTTAIAASTSVVSTSLTSYDSGRDDYFNGWWVSITDKANAGVSRQVSDYATATGTLTVRGANLTTDGANLATCRLHRYNPANKVNAIKRAMEQIYPTLYKPIDNQWLITGNFLPNAHFEDWAVTTRPDFYLPSATATVVATQTAGTFRGGATAMKITAGAASDYAYINSNTYPRLLDLRGQSVSFYCWAIPQTANDAILTIVATDADGTAHTNSSTTACPVTYPTLLKLEDVAISADAARIEIRFVVTTNGQYAYFDDALLISGSGARELALPSNLQEMGHVSQVRMQSTGYYIPACYDINPQWGGKAQFTLRRTGDYSPAGTPATYDYIELGDIPLNAYRLKLTGYAPLESLTSDSTTTWLDGSRLNLIVAKAAAILFKREQGPVSSADKGRYSQEIAYWEMETARLSARLGMTLPSDTIRT